MGSSGGESYRGRRSASGSRAAAGAVAFGAFALAVAAIALVPGASAGFSCPVAAGGGCFEPTLAVDFGGRVMPERLPSRVPAPVAIELWAKVTTNDGSHLSALREATIDFDRGLAAEVDGLPVCHPFVRRRVGDLAKRCRSAIVGSGDADFEVAVPEGKPILRSAELNAYNGGNGTLYVVAFAAQPLPRVIVVPVEVVRKGRSGLHTLAKVPRLAGGRGSLVDFDLRIKRLFASGGEPKSYLTAKCPDDRIDTLGDFSFRNEAHEPGVPATTSTKGEVAIPCTAR